MNYLFSLIICTLVIGLAYTDPLVYRKRIIFPGPEYHTQRIRFPAHQELAPTTFTPYPAAGFKPDPPFELPNREAAYFSPLETDYETPNDLYGPPIAGNSGILQDNSEIPQRAYGAPEQTYEVPEQSFVPSTTPEFIDLHEYFPKTKLTLPHVERSTVFRSEPLQRPLPVIQKNFKSSLKVTKGQRPDSRPVLKRPSKITATLKHREKPQRVFAQLQPIIRHRVNLPDGTISYSERPQDW